MKHTQGQCSYHNKTYDGSRRYDKDTANSLFPIGYEMRWRSHDSGLVSTIPCACGKGYFPDAAEIRAGA